MRVKINHTQPGVLLGPSAEAMLTLHRGGVYGAGNLADFQSRLWVDPRKVQSMGNPPIVSEVHSISIAPTIANSTLLSYGNGPQPSVQSTGTNPPPAMVDQIGSFMGGHVPFAFWLVDVTANDAEWKVDIAAGGLANSQTDASPYFRNNLYSSLPGTGNPFPHSYQILIPVLRLQPLNGTVNSGAPSEQAVIESVMTPAGVHVDNRQISYDHAYDNGLFRAGQAFPGCKDVQLFDTNYHSSLLINAWGVDLEVTGIYFTPGVVKMMNNWSQANYISERALNRIGAFTIRDYINAKNGYFNNSAKRDL